MKLQLPLYACTVLILAMIAASLYAYAELPADARVAVHFGLSGRADGFAPKALGLSILPLITVGVVVLLVAAPGFTPKKEGLEASAPAYGRVMIAVVALMTVCQFALAAHALDQGFDVIRTLVLALGVMALVLGNYLGKTRQNYVFGIRTPWTLGDARVWDKTHRFTGRLMFLGGLVLMAAFFVPAAAPARLALVLACLIGPALAGVVYSAMIFPRRRSA